LRRTDDPSTPGYGDDRPRMATSGNSKVSRPRLGEDRGELVEPSYFSSKRSRPDLHRYCTRMTGSVADGEDVQDTIPNTGEISGFMK
jgi:hypothetical protein